MKKFLTWVVWDVRSPTLRFMRFGWVATIIVISLAVLVGGGALIVTPFMRAYDERQCTRFHEQTGYDTRFTRFSYWTWECYARTDSGKWIPSARLKNDNG